MSSTSQGVAAPALTREQLEAFPDAAFASDTDGCIVHWSSAAERILGWPRALAERTMCALLLDGLGRDGQSLCHARCPLRTSTTAGPSILRDHAPRGGWGRVGWEPVPRAAVTEAHPDMVVARPDGSRSSVTVVAFPALLDGVPVLLHLLRDTGLADRDGLTGALTREAFVARANDEQHRAARYSRFLSLALIDVDRLKDINDQLGHASGDRALMTVAQRLVAGRRGDLVGRWGGDEFVLLLPETDAHGAVCHLQEALAAVSSSDVIAGRTVSFSAAAVDLGPTEELDEALRRADELLYAAKQAGRGRVVRAGESAPRGTAVFSPAPRAGQVRNLPEGTIQLRQ